MLQLIFALLVSRHDSQILTEFGKNCEFRGDPSVHLIAAQVASIEYGIRTELLLEIAEHESCFDNEIVTGRCSGVMQTMGERPKTLIEGYERGAQELREWLAFAHGDLRVALAGYSGGVKIARQCASGGDCSYADLFLGRAERLRKSFEKAQLARNM